MDGISDSMNISLSKLQVFVMDKKAGVSVGSLRESDMNERLTELN